MRCLYSACLLILERRLHSASRWIFLKHIQNTGCFFAEQQYFHSTYRIQGVFFAEQQYFWSTCRIQGVFLLNNNILKVHTEYRVIFCWTTIFLKYIQNKACFFCWTTSSGFGGYFPPPLVNNSATCLFERLPWETQGSTSYSCYHLSRL